MEDRRDINEDEIELYSVDYASDCDVQDETHMLRYRAVTCADTRPAAWSFSTSESVQIAREPAMTAAVTEHNSKSSDGLKDRPADRNVHTPTEKPFGLPSSTQFALSVSTADCCDSIVERISWFLDEPHIQANYDFSFQPQSYTWKGKHIEGSCCIELDVRLYLERDSNNFTVAVLKMRGGQEAGGISFMDFFYALRENLTGVASSRRSSRRESPVDSTDLLLPAPSVEEFLEGSKPIIQMAQEGFFEPRLEAAKMLSDISRKDSAYIETPIFRSECLSVLEALVQDKFDDVRQHAVMALASFLELPSYQDAILSATSVLLPVLFSAIDNAPNHQKNSWETAKVRRTAAGIVAVLSSRNAPAVRGQLESVHGIDVLAWAEQIVPVLQDAKTKEFASSIVTLLLRPDCDDELAIPPHASSGQSFFDVVNIH